MKKARGRKGPVISSSHFSKKNLMCSTRVIINQKLIPTDHFNMNNKNNRLEEFILPLTYYSGTQVKKQNKN